MTYLFIILGASIELLSFCGFLILFEKYGG